MIWRVRTWLLRWADKHYGERIIYGHFSSAGIDRLYARSENNKKTRGNTDYTDLASFLYSHPL